MGTNIHMETIQKNMTSDDIKLESDIHSNESLSESLTTLNCTTLTNLDLIDVFTKLSIGNKDFWGTASTLWLALYYIHFTIFFTLLLIITCWCGLILWEKGQSVRKHASLVYVVSTYCVWSFTSATYYVLLTIGVNSLASRQLAITTEIFEILSVASLMNGLLVTAVYQYYQLRFHVYQSIKKYIAYTIPSLLTAVIIIIVLLSTSGLALIVLMVLTLMLVIIGLVGTTTLVVMYTELWFRTKTSRSLHGNSARKVLTRRLVVRVLTFVYLPVLTCSLVNCLIIVIINMNCIENAQGSRFLWLAEQSLLKVFELLLILQCLVVPQRLQKIINKIFWSSKPVKTTQSSIMNKSIINTLSQPEDFNVSWFMQSVRLETCAPWGSIEMRAEENKNTSDSASKSLPLSKTRPQPAQFQASALTVQQPPRHVKCIALPPNVSNAVENEYLSHACGPTYNPERKTYLKIEEITSVHETTYHKPDNGNFMNSVLTDIPLQESLKGDTLSLSPLHVEVVPAHSPVDTDNLIGDIEVGLFDERGGVFHSYKHGVTVVVPTGAIPIGVLAELKFAATLVGNVKFTNKSPVSAIYWLCMDVELQKSIELYLPHFADISDATHNLQFVKSIHSPFDVIEGSMFSIDGGKFPIDEPYGSIQIDHFCYYCIAVDKLERTSIPNNKYSIVAITQRQPEKSEWTAHICILPLIRTCVEKLKSQYGSEWQYRSLSEFSFTPGCDQVFIECEGHIFKDKAEVVLLSNDEIYQQDVDFHHYYDSDCLDELRLRMDEQLYPPRFTVVVHAKDKIFFESSRYMNYKLTSGTKTISGKLTVPSVDVFGLSSSESDSSLKRKKYGSFTSGYRSDDSIEHLPDEQEFATGKLQFRNLIVLTMSVNLKWFALGCALCVPIDKLERLGDKYHDNPMKALVRVYRYWLADKNGLQPTWEKLLSALQKINEYRLATSLTRTQLSKDQCLSSSVFNDDSNEPEKELVMRNIRLEMLNLTALIPVLNKHHLLTLDDNYVLLNYLVSPMERANALVYQILPSKGPGVFKQFIICLQEETEHIGHQELARMLTPPAKPKMMETTV